MQVAELDRLQEALIAMKSFVQQAVERLLHANRNPMDELRGLVITDDEVTHHLKTAPQSLHWSAEFPRPKLYQPATDPQNRLFNFLQTFELTVLEFNIFLLAAAPHFDRQFERLFAYLQDDISQKNPTVNLMMTLLGDSLNTRFDVWRCLAPEQPLRKHGLIQFIEPDGRGPASYLANQLTMDYRLIAHLLGNDCPDERLKGLLNTVPDSLSSGILPEQTRTILTSSDQAPLVYLHGTEGHHQAALEISRVYNVPLLEGNLHQTMQTDKTLWKYLMREGRLQNAALLLTHWESILDEDGQPPADFWQSVQSYRNPVFLQSRETWEPANSGRTRRMFRLTIPKRSQPEREELWISALEQYGIRVDRQDIAPLGKFRLSDRLIAQAVDTAADLASTQGQPINLDDLIAGAQAHSNLQLGRLAKRMKPDYVWEDMVLPADQIAQLKELCARAEYTHTVLNEWGLGLRSGARSGINALFVGESGTGKTMSAQVIAHQLGLLLYRVDLSMIVSKYIGETEKNLNTIFEQAQSSNAILFFDEADALFGKRTEVKDSHDRYANIETAYLLQQIEDHDGIAILATNLRQNLDDAFIRRLDFVIEFPLPDENYRRLIWERHFPAEVPLGKDVNMAELAKRYVLAGGNIRNVAVASAYLAAADGRVVTMEHIHHAVRREHQKMGRLIM